MASSDDDTRSLDELLASVHPGLDPVDQAIMDAAPVKLNHTRSGAVKRERDVVERPRTSKRRLAPPEWRCMQAIRVLEDHFEDKGGVSHDILYCLETIEEAVLFG
jgi:hypothetical protein